MASKITTEHNKILRHGLRPKDPGDVLLASEDVLFLGLFYLEGGVYGVL
jgi:hypothetical protein